MAFHWEDETSYFAVYDQETTAGFEQKSSEGQFTDLRDYTTT